MPPAGGPKPFSVGDAFGYGWKKFTENLGPILIAMLVFFLIGAVLYGLQFVLQTLTAPESTTVVTSENSFEVTQTTTSPLGVLVSLVFAVILFVWQYLVQAAVARGGLAVTEGRPIVLGELLSFSKLGRIILGGIILGFLVLIGLFLCIIPGLIVAFLGSYFVYFILDQDQGAWESIKSSFAFVKDNVGNLLLVFLLSLVIVFVGALLCGVGLLVAYPVVYIAYAYAYKVLRGQPVAP